MCTQLAKAARNAIIIHSKGNNHLEAITKLQKYLINGPLYCFGYHEKCSTDFCKTVKKLNASELNNANLPAKINSSSNTRENITKVTNDNNNCHVPEVATADEDNTEGTLDHNDNITEMISYLQEAWYDVIDDQRDTLVYPIEEIRNISATPPKTELENSIICDIQCIASRLLDKAPQLIGKITALLNK